MANETHLKVGLVLDDGLDKPDGVQQYMLTLGNWLAAEGHNVHYLVGQTSRKDIPNVHSLSRNMAVNANGNTMTIPLPTSRRKLRRLLREENFDVLHVQTPYSPFMGGRLIKLAGPKTAVIGTFHILPNSGLVSFGNRLLGLWCYRSLKRVDSMLSVSQAAARYARQSFYGDSDISPNVIEYDRFASATALPEYNDGVLTILFLGRLVPRKGCQLLLKALMQLVQRTDLPKFRLVICGSGPLEKQLRKDAQDYGLGGITTFAGFVAENVKPQYYASSDLTVFPSSGGESFGIVLLEAMASGKAAVLAGNNPGYASIMAPNPELLFDPKDADGLAKRIELFLQDSELRRQMADWGHDYAHQFDVNVIGPVVVDIYNKALRKRRGE